VVDIVLRVPDGHFRIGKIIVLRDNSLIFTVPNHAYTTATLLKFPIEASTNWQFRTIAKEEIGGGQATGCVVKLSMHASGFVQFSGKGLISGQEIDGRAKGMGVQTWSPDRPPQGPAFGITFSKLEGFEQLKAMSADSFVIDSSKEPLDDNGTHVYCYIRTKHDRRFIRYTGDAPHISMVHPSGHVIDLPVFIPPMDTFKGFFAFECFAMEVPFPNGVGFQIAGPTGNPTKTRDGRRISEGMVCFCPALKVPLTALSDLTFVKPVT
jgi:hypothetical protein